VSQVQIRRLGPADAADYRAMDACVIGMAGYKRQEGARDGHKAYIWGTYVQPRLRRQLGFGVYGIEPRALKSSAGYADEVLMVRFFSAMTTGAK
jgi:hypothetical protein